MMIGMASFAIDIGFVVATKNELQNAADAAALAAARQMGVIYEGLTIEEQQAYDFDPISNPLHSTHYYDQIVPAAQTVVGQDRNTAGGNVLTIQIGDIKINAWEDLNFIEDSWKETPPRLFAPTAVKINIDTDISFFFARILGLNDMNISVSSIAALSNTNLPPATDPNRKSDLIPVGLASTYFDGQSIDDYCEAAIDFLSTGPCAAWLISGSETPEQVLERMRIDPTYEMAIPQVGDGLNLVGGISARSTARQKFKDAFNDVNRGGGIEWLVSVIIFDNPVGNLNCQNLNQSLNAVGFAEVLIKDADNMTGEIQCSFYKGRGYGSDFPLKGTIPALVQ